MKKIMLVVFGLFLSAGLKAQIAPNAIGLRFGGGNGFGTEFSYQKRLSNLNRLEFDLGLKNSSNYDAWSLAGLYEWVWPLDLGEPGFSWYAGVGGRIGYWDWDSLDGGKDNDGIYLAIPGVIGVEYAFPFGLQLALDLRPELGMVNTGDALDLDMGLCVRYRF